MEKVFRNGSKHDSRQIMININGGYIEFFYYQQYLKKKVWIIEENERREESGEDSLTKYEECNDPFYWFGTSDWKRDKTENLDRHDNWHTHMKEKTWFTNEMEKFLNDNI